MAPGPFSTPPNINDPAQLLAWVYQLLTQGNLAEAQQLAYQAIITQPSNPDARCTMAAVHDFSGNLDAAILGYQGVLQADPQRPQIRAWIGQAFFYKGDFNAALSWINTELASNPRSALAHSMAGSVYAVSGDEANSEREFRSAMSLDSDIATLRERHANAFYATRQFSRAAAEFVSVTRMAPTLPGPYLGAGLAYAALSERQTAVAWLERYLQMQDSGDLADRARKEIERMRAPDMGSSPGVQYVGIPSETMRYFTASQHNSQWCWAASIQMVLNYLGVDISQEQIVARTYGVETSGNLPNRAGDFQRITGNLNNWSIDNRGRPYVVSSFFGSGAPPPSYLLSELAAGRPVIVGYASGPSSGHAVVITAASWTPSANGPMIRTLVVRDPWPSPENIANRGRVEYTGVSLAQNMRHYWFVRTQPLPTATPP